MMNHLWNQQLSENPLPFNSISIIEVITLPLLVLSQVEPEPKGRLRCCCCFSFFKINTHFPFNRSIYDHKQQGGYPLIANVYRSMSHQTWQVLMTLLKCYFALYIVSGLLPVLIELPVTSSDFFCFFYSLCEIIV